MVYNTVRMVKLPHHNASNMTSMSANSKHGMNFIKGSGMGSVLLRSGGPGGASSYMDMDDYIATTGINPYARASAPQGKGLASSITNKLSKLNIAPPTTSQRKNIVMSM